MNKLVSCAVAIALSFGTVACWAGKTIEIGRFKVALKEDAWVGSVDVPISLELMSAQGSFKGKGKVLTLTGSGGERLAVMYVGGTYGQSNVYSVHRACGKNPDIYIRDLNTNPREDVRCAIAGGPFDSTTLLDRALPFLKDAAKTVDVVAPDTAYFVGIHVTNHGGLVIDINALLAPAFVGLVDGKPVADLPGNLAPGVAAWADRMAESAIKALTSFSGELVVPPVEFSNTTK